MVIFTGGIHRTARPAKKKLNKDFNHLNEIFWLFLPLQHVRSWLALTMSFLKSGVVLLSRLRSLTTILGFCWWSLWLRFSKMCLHLPSPSIYTGKRETPTHNTDLLRLVLFENYSYKWEIIEMPVCFISSQICNPDSKLLVLSLSMCGDLRERWTFVKFLFFHPFPAFRGCSYIT